MEHDTHKHDTRLNRMGKAFRRVGRNYSPQEDRRLAGHLGSLVAFGVYTAVWGMAIGMRKAELPGAHRPTDVVVTAAAVFRLGRLLSKGSVTSPLRAPFTRYEEATGPAEVQESPRGGPIRSTVGELVTCPFCLSVWLTTTFTGAHLLWPKATRAVTGGLATLALADTMQLGYDSLTQKNAE
ncbi:DUF1360 domain-containing protein [Streptomyces sp. OspMP-M43]|uniref:DUF1360 domain-containing protein n=1 Tax=Streptomyces sp. OspMP-M43 TaxID=1839781 RepID=UPI001EFA7B5E|nr:DUF1360 domain-containing protein [Streptomyces sp. OspMP-M43]